MNASTLSKQVSISCLAATISAVIVLSLMCVAVREAVNRRILSVRLSVTWQMA